MEDKNKRGIPLFTVILNRKAGMGSCVHGLAWQNVSSAPFIITKS